MHQRHNVHALVGALLLVAAICGHQASGQSIPGAKTASAIIASSSNGMARYLAPDGPIQPGVAMVAGLPMRGAELLNKGITRVSQAFGSGASSMSRRAGAPAGTMAKMPGVAQAQSMMPQPIKSMGNMMANGVKSKNSFIMGQAQKGIDAGNRMRTMMGGQARRKRSAGLEAMSDMMMKGNKMMTDQIKQSLGGHMDRLSGLQGIGGNMRNSIQRLGQTLGEGMAEHVQSFRKTTSKMASQMDGDMKKNLKSVSGMMGSMHGSVDNMGKNMGKNLQELLKAGQGMDIQGHLQRTLSMPMEMMQSLKKGAQGSSMGGNRY